MEAFALAYTLALRRRPTIAIGRSLSMDSASLNKARRDLAQASLIAYEKPLYQVLALDLPRASPPNEARPGQLRSLREWLAASLEKTS